MDHLKAELKLARVANECSKVDKLCNIDLSGWGFERCFFSVHRVQLFFYMIKQLSLDHKRVPAKGKLILEQRQILAQGKLTADGMPKHASVPKLRRYTMQKTTSTVSKWNIISYKILLISCWQNCCLDLIKSPILRFEYGWGELCLFNI